MILMRWTTRLACGYDSETSAISVHSLHSNVCLCTHYFPHTYSSPTVSPLISPSPTSYTEMNSLRELAELDLERVPEPLLSSSSSLLVLREGVQLLQLELWLREEEMEELLPQLVNAGHSSIHSLLSLNPYFLEKVLHLI